MTETKGYSLTDRVFERLEQDILSEKYRSGEILSELSLSKQLGVSRTPIREAVRRLEQENLIEYMPKGIKVLGISAEDVKDIFDVRLAIEGLAVKKSAEKVTDEQLKILEETVELQEFYTARNDADHIKNMDSRFHEKIYECCNSSTYSEILSLLHKKTQRYRMLSVENEQRAKEAVKEHRKILNALISRDGEKAKKLTEQHIINAKKNILGGK